MGKIDLKTIECVGLSLHWEMSHSALLHHVFKD